MTEGNIGANRAYRINVQFERQDNPLLAAELDKFRKGAKRHNRLLILATLGLTVESKARAAPVCAGPGVNADSEAASRAESAAYPCRMSEDDVRALLGDEP